MRRNRRRVIAGSFSLLVLAGCLGETSLSTPFDLRIGNQGSRSRELSVGITHVGTGTVYDDTHKLAPGETVTESAIIEKPGRYRITVTDRTTDEERTAERDLELTTGEGFCGWIAVWAAFESVAVSVPRCPENRDLNGTVESPGS